MHIFDCGAAIVMIASVGLFRVTTCVCLICAYQFVEVDLVSKITAMHLPILLSLPNTACRSKRLINRCVSKAYCLLLAHGKQQRFNLLLRDIGSRHQVRREMEFGKQSSGDLRICPT